MSSPVCRASRTFLAAAAVVMLLPTVALTSSRTASQTSSWPARARPQSTAGLSRSSPRWDTAADAIYTYVTLDVQQSWGLPGQPARVVVKQLGRRGRATPRFSSAARRSSKWARTCCCSSTCGRAIGRCRWPDSSRASGRCPDRAAATAMTRDVHGTDPGMSSAPTAARSPTSTPWRRMSARAPRRRGASVDGALGAAPVPGAGGDLLRPAFTLLSPGTPARWHEADTSTPVYVDTQAGGHPQFAGGGLTQLAQAAALWSGPGSLRAAAGRRPQRALLHQQRAERWPHLGDLRRSVRRDRRRQLDDWPSAAPTTPRVCSGSSTE